MALTKDECWRYIRASRHRPPGFADKGQRKLVYASAMKQAEQFFLTADTAGYEIKPILLYYGLNQATRALAAACIPVHENWNVGSHGLACRNLDQNPGLAKLEEQGRGVYQVLAGICESPTLVRPTAVGEVWVSLPQGAEVPLTDTDEYWSAARLLLNELYRALTDAGEWPARLSNAPTAVGDLPHADLWTALVEHHPGLAAMGFELWFIEGQLNLGWSGRFSRRSIPVITRRKLTSYGRRQKFERELMGHSAACYPSSKLKSTSLSQS